MGQADTSRTAAHLPRAAADDSADARACLSTAGRSRPGAAALTTGRIVKTVLIAALLGACWFLTHEVDLHALTSILDTLPRL
jgi:hypothetical protein